MPPVMTGMHNNLYEMVDRIRCPTVFYLPLQTNYFFSFLKFQIEAAMLPFNLLVTLRTIINLTFLIFAFLGIITNLRPQFTANQHLPALL